MNLHLGIGGVGAALAVILWFGTTSGGKLSLSWGWTLFLSMTAGCAFRAAGAPFSWISDLVNDVLGMFGSAVPTMTTAGMAVVILVLVLFRKMTLRGLAMSGIVFFTAAAGAEGGPFGWYVQLIESAATYWA
ncbi:hypothetical protein B0E38_07756 [Streptomyces sp. 111WW2]|uniref:hypothetical protein n=1 Tax=Streptomyces sp. 111WW2 TaxID=1945515 RepID=UPI000D0C9145|nr:hypothetical protein [Streptomyces sp. 111WW2]PSK43951.1 hypothetical protein B0E38_07756 [Streptomyces sp. 111WW2]